MKKSWSVGRRVLKGSGICLGLLVASNPLALGTPAQLSTDSYTYWTGNGVSPRDSGGYVFNSSLCDEDGTAYVYFVLAGTKSDSASITIGDSSFPMSKANGTKKGSSSFSYFYSPSNGIELATLLGDGSNIFTTHNDARSRGILTVSHGCLGTVLPEATITITSTAPESPELGGTYTPTATSTSGESVVITVDPSSSSVCSISGGVVTFNGVGTCTLNFNDPGNANFVAAPQQQQTLVVTDPVNGLTIRFRPVDSYQVVKYCSNGTEATVCSAMTPPRLLNWTSFTNAGAVLQDYNIPLATLNSENSATGLFNISVVAPGSLPIGTIIGPGVGITCLQRSGSTLVGTVNGALSLDRTGAGIVSGVQWYSYWYSGCSLDPSVTHAYFYAYTGPIPPPT